MAEEKQQLDWDKIKNFSKQVSNDIGAAMLGALSYIGDRLGIFSALAASAAVLMLVTPWAFNTAAVVRMMEKAITLEKIIPTMVSIRIRSSS